MQNLRNVALLVVLLAVPGLAGAAELENAVLQVEGMTCGGCAAGLQAMLGQVEGIAGAQVDLEAGRAYLAFDPSQVDPETVAAGISKEGIQAKYLPGERTPEAVAVALIREKELSDADMERAVAWVVEQLSGPSFQGAISREAIEAAIGVAVPDSELNRLQSGVMAELQSNHPAVLAKLTSGSRCAEYGACSLEGNLTGATGDTLKMYKKEKAEDGTKYVDFLLPEFEAQDLDGNVVRSASLRGKPTLLALLAGHCNHCHDSLPILQETVDTWGPRGVQVVGIVVNSGSVQDVNEWIPMTDPRWDVWVLNDDSLGDLLGSHLVPSYFLIDADGRVIEKLVGFKEKEEVLGKVAAFAEDRDNETAALGAR